MNRSPFSVIDMGTRGGRGLFLQLLSQKVIKAWIKAHDYLCHQMQAPAENDTADEAKPREEEEMERVPMMISLER